MVPKATSFAETTFFFATKILLPTSNLLRKTIDIQIVNTWSLYSGFGASAKFLTDDFKDWSLAAGARFFAGVNTLFYDGYLELYAQQNIVPTYLKKLGQGDSDASFMLCLPFEAGLRMHF